MSRRVVCTALLAVFLMGHPWGLEAATQDAVWELRLVATVSGQRGSVLILEGSFVMPSEMSQAWGGGSFVYRDRSLRVSSGSWTVLSVLQWPDAQIPEGRRLEILISLPLPNHPAALAELSIRGLPRQTAGRVTVEVLGHPDFLASGIGVAYLMAGAR